MELLLMGVVILILGYVVYMNIGKAGKMKLGKWWLYIVLFILLLIGYGDVAVSLVVEEEEEVERVELPSKRVEIGDLEAIREAYPEESKVAKVVGSIEEVEIEYGVPWIYGEEVGKYKLEELYIVGESEFVLGYYENIEEGKSIFLHMSVDASEEVLRAGLAYKEEVEREGYSTYETEEGMIVGFKVEVEVGGSKEIYVATSSGGLELEEIADYVPLGIYEIVE